jgi:hypothetical protein
VQPWSPPLSLHEDTITMNDYTPITEAQHAALIEQDMQAEVGDSLAVHEAAAAELTADAHVRLRHAFADYKDDAGNLAPHCPSQEMLDALKDAQHAMSRMAARIAAQEFTLSSLDPGVGKSQALVHWIKALLASNNSITASASVVVFIFTKAELWERVEVEDPETGLKTGQVIERGLICEIFGSTPQEREQHRRRFAVLVGKDEPEMNALGRPDHDKAQILFTTQAQLDDGLSRTGQKFEDIHEFWYYDSPRPVRVHDEGLLPATPVRLDADDLLQLALIFKSRRDWAGASMRFRTAAIELLSAEAGTRFTLFDPRDVVSDADPEHHLAGR